MRRVALLMFACTMSCRAPEPGEPSPVIDEPLACGTMEAMAVPIVPLVTVEGTTAGNSESATRAATCDGALGPEAIYYIETDHVVDLLWQVVPDFDGVAYVRKFCDGNQELECADGEPTLGVETAEVLDAAPNTYFLFVDGWGDADAGHYTATLRLREIVSEDGACDPEVVLTRCEEGLGCNEDSLTCTQEQVCTNIIDDDGDGLLDCEDPDDCQTQDVCAPGDGLTGEPCALPSDCYANATDPFCWDELQFGYPGGACSEFCDIGVNDCGGEALCLDVGLVSGSGLCLNGCELDDDCPDGYECATVGDYQLCAPACTDDAQCPGAGFCNKDTGDCTQDDEDCADGFENDGDLRVDCEDADCAYAAACQTAVDAVCGDATPVGDAVMGDTTDGSAVFAGSCTGMGGAPESVHTYTSVDNGLVLFELVGDADLGLYARTDCALPDTQITCADAQEGGDTEILAVVMDGIAPVTVVVDGFMSPIEAGPYTLTSTFFESDELEPNDTIESADTAPSPMAAGISPVGDQDWIQVELTEPATALKAEVEGLAVECEVRQLDSEVEIIAADGTRLAFNDDRAQDNFCSRAQTSSLEAGTYYVRVSASQLYAPQAVFPYVLVLTITP